MGEKKAEVLILTTDPFDELTQPLALYNSLLLYVGQNDKEECATRHYGQ